MKKQFESHSPQDTLSLGESIGGCLEPGDIVLLFGDLGAGKTTLTQGMARGLGVPSEEYVRSPSFTLINEYRGKTPVYHIDLYRIASALELEDLGIEETLFGQGVTIVEWAEKLFNQKTPGNALLGLDRWLEIHIKIGETDSRTLELRTLNMGPETHPIFTLH